MRLVFQCSYILQKQLVFQIVRSSKASSLPTCQVLQDSQSLWCRDSNKPIYQRRVSSIARLLCLEWTHLLDPPGWLLGTDDGAVVYESSIPAQKGQSWQDAHLWRHESEKGSHGTRNVTREIRQASCVPVGHTLCIVALCRTGLVTGNKSSHRGTGIVYAWLSLLG